jgi:hypothetical protein
VESENQSLWKEKVIIEERKDETDIKGLNRMVLTSAPYDDKSMNRNPKTWKIFGS